VGEEEPLQIVTVSLFEFAVSALAVEQLTQFLRVRGGKISVWVEALDW
jgi:hypothetical protein